MKYPSLSTKIAAALGIAVISVQGCRSHSSTTSCGDPYLTNVTYVGYGGVGWGGYVVDPYYSGYGYAPGGAGWFDPGDDYDPSVPEPPDGWDGNDSSYFPGADDPSSDVGDPSGGVPSDTGGGDDTSGSGSDTAGTTADTTSVKTRGQRVSIASNASTIDPELPDANGCYSCLVGCRVGTGASETGRQAVAGSSYDYASACRSAVHRVERWAHSEQSAPIVDCQVLIPTPTSDADAGPDADSRTSAEASVGDDDASATPDASTDTDAAADAGDSGLQQ